MIGNRTCLADIRRTSDAPTDPKQSMEPRCYRPAASNPAREPNIQHDVLSIFLSLFGRGFLIPRLQIVQIAEKSAARE